VCCEARAVMGAVVAAFSLGYNKVLSQDIILILSSKSPRKSTINFSLDNLWPG
jgi:hypothetical protein